MTNGSVSLLLFFESYATPKIVQVIMKDYSLGFGEFQYEKTLFSDMQIVTILQSHEACRTVKDIYREHEIREPTFYNWKAKYGGMEVSEIRRIKDLETENAFIERKNGSMRRELLNPYLFHSLNEVRCLSKE
jgi:putative transposase